MYYDFDSIKKLRQGLNLTQSEFASILKVDRQRIGQLENDKVKPNVATLEKIMDAFKVRPDFFFKHINDNVNVIHHSNETANA